ncbi:MAG: helix-turn-helix domain-containing protein, partial [Myxococcota bacterium]
MRRAIVEAYTSGRSGSYSQTAALFGVGRATVGRILRRFRETGDVKPGKLGGHRPRAVPDDWLLE